MSSLTPLTGWVKRTQRYPQYSDEDLTDFFEELSKGYCYRQAASRAGLNEKTLMNTIYSDDELADWCLSLCMVAGAAIRAGDQPVPARWDGLYRKYEKDD